MNIHWKELVLKLKLQYFGHLIWRADSLEKTLVLGKIEGKRRGGGPENEMVGWHHWLNRHEFKQTLGDSEGQDRKPGMLQSMGLQSRTWLSYRTTITEPSLQSQAAKKRLLFSQVLCRWKSLENQVLHADAWKTSLCVTMAYSYLGQSIVHK